MSMRQSQPVIRAFLAVSAALSAAAFGQAAGVHNNQHLRFTHVHGLTFSEIGNPGNAHYEFKEFPGDTIQRFGGVDYSYRMSTTEITGGQWHEFVVAYAPYVGVEYNTARYRGYSDFVGRDANGVPQYILHSNPQSTVEMGWRFAARYCNWLHNGKPTGPDVEQWVFESGAYDTSTFTNNPDGTVNDQATRSPGAKFWIPSRDEWVKAAYWDPNRDGEGEGGYWEHPYASDDPVATGPASDGGQTNAGPFIEGTGYLVGSYPDVNAPWGLLDVSGGEREWLEDFQWDYPRDRLIKGSRLDMGEFYYFLDEIQHISPGSARTSTSGLRIAAAIPAPSSTITLFAALAAGNSMGFARRRSSSYAVQTHISGHSARRVRGSGGGGALGDLR